MHKRFLSIMLTLACVLSMLPSLPAQAASFNYYSSPPDPTTYTKIYETDWIEEGAKPLSEIEKEFPAGTDYVYIQKDNVECYHYFSFSVGPHNVYEGGHWQSVGRIPPNTNFTLPARLAWDGQDHTYRSGGNAGGYMIWGFQYKSVACVRGVLSQCQCKALGEKYGKWVTGGFLNPTHALNEDHNGQPGTNYGQAICDWKQAPYGGYGLHGAGICADGKSDACFSETPSFGNGSAALSDGYHHGVSLVKYICFRANGYMVNYVDNKPAWAMLKNLEGDMASERHIPGETFKLQKNSYILDGGKFKGWNTKADGSGTSYTDEQTVTDIANKGEVLNLYAQWENVSIPPGTELKYIRSANPTIYALWRPIKYYGVYRSNDGTNSEVKHPEILTYDEEYVALTQEETGFAKTGYYIKYWEHKDNEPQRVYSGDKDWPAGTARVEPKFKNLHYIEYETGYLDAIWEPIKYTLRVHENFPGSPTDRTKDYTLTYDTAFVLPNSPWVRSDGVMLGYDFNKTAKVNPTYKCQESVINLTTVRDSVVDIYCIWDLPPKVTCPKELHLNRADVAASGLAVDNGTVSQSDLEAYLLTLGEATDYEYEYRNTAGAKIPMGTSNGYTYQIASIKPADIVGSAQDKNSEVYYVTYEAVDDAGQSATAVMTMFVGDVKVDILIH